MYNIWEERRDNKVTKDGRSSYAKDYARVIHSSAFRRLQNKTQVFGFGTGDSDFYRTRLTHSMEVSQIGEGIARFLLCDKSNEYKICGNINNKTKYISRDDYIFLIRTICLAHDLGHPPFGHGGETALNRCMREHGGFEANGQTLRILASLPSYHKSYGMNLCRRSLLGILKYPAPYNKVVNKNLYDKGQYYQKTARYNPSVFKAESFKPPKCYLNTEKDVVDWISKKLEKKDWKIVSTKFEKKKHKKTKYMALDTSIMELADDIAYGIHDLEDAISLKLIDKAIFEHCISENTLHPFFEWNSTTQFNKSYKNYKTFITNLFANELETYKRKKAIGTLVDFCIRNTKLIDRNKNLKNKKILSPIFRYQAALDKKAKDILNMLEKLIFERVIKSTTVQQLEYKGQKIVTELFHAYATDPTRLLTEKDCRRYKKAKGRKKEQFRVICDYISGMTDEYAIKRYEQLFEPRMGSVFDRL